VPLFRATEDFDAVLAAAGEQLGLRAGVVEKDYWVTQALRGMQRAFTDAFIFKGGTSLSKAYGLIQRFSEDIDILLRDEELSKSGREKRMKQICEAAANEIEAGSEKLSGGKSYRTVELFLGERREPEPPTLPFIRLDVGFSGGIEPHGTRKISTLIGELLERNEQGEEGAYDDLSPFNVTVLAPWRTMIEKLILVNCVARDCQDDVDAVARLRAGRHFYDVYSLLGDGEVLAALGDRSRFTEVVEDALRITRDHFNVTYERPDGGFAAGLAYSCDGALREAFEVEYAAIMDAFYFGDEPYPSFAATVDRVEEYAELL
jgi:predicted nucleotidyltransferase component of viral defense system